MHRFANPTRFLRIVDLIRPWAIVLTVALLGAGLVWGLVFAPPDYQQGDTVRIMYIHVPAAWMAMFVYGVIAVASAVGLIWKHPVADLSAKASAPIGAAFALITLVSGSLWGQPMWGTWWVWDARLTSMLLLFFLYVGYIALWQAYDDPGRAARAAAILALVGSVNLPVIKFSVDWWNTLHQPASVMTLSGPKIHPTILVPLILMILGFNAYYVTVWCYRVKAEVLGRKVRILRLGRAEAAASVAATP